MRPDNDTVAAVGAISSLVNVQVTDSPASTIIFARLFARSTVVFGIFGVLPAVSTHSTEVSLQPGTELSVTEITCELWGTPGSENS